VKLAEAILDEAFVTKLERQGFVVEVVPFDYECQLWDFTQCQLTLDGKPARVGVRGSYLRPDPR
jgi:hypothetical protein